ncbi:uncharacterized protein LOC108114946 [Drosophila eugracilis]|uniref:uncharacterized protein LOC108114946 n=1 Tax=Drosophila eugracilis TaxID=29029 RepID=UPI0007E78E8B|nr:uncharacterized protein LOC108114946 [Drosophila eugracilis]
MSSRMISVWILVVCFSFFVATPADGKGYQLWINHPDGSAFRRESVTEDAEGNPEVEGEIRQMFPAPHEGLLVLSYKTGSEGYRIRYSYKADSGNTPLPIVPRNETLSVKRIGVNALKSTAG